MVEISIVILIQQLGSGDLTGFKQLYQSFRLDFFRFGLKHNCTQEEVEEVYNDTFIALHDNLLAGKITSLESTIKTYVFGIGKYMLYAKIKGRDRSRRSLDDVKIPIDFFNPFESKSSDKTEQLKSGLSKLGDKCQEILELFYYKKFSIEAIQHHLQYKNENTVKAHKSRCMKKLKEIISNENNTTI